MHVPIGDTYEFLFTTRDFDTGAPQTLGGTPALSVYEEGNTTEITAGVSLSADYDTRTGLNQASIVASSGNGYEVGKYYSVVITTGTVDSVSVVGEVVGHFRVMPAEDAGAGIPDVNVTHVGDSAEDIATATALATVDTVVDGIQTDLSNGTDGLGAIKTAIDNQNDVSAADVNAQCDTAISDAALATAAALATVDANVDAILLDTGTTLPASIATIDSNVDAILVDTNELQGDLTNGGRLDLLIDAIKAVTDAIPDSGAMSSIAQASALATVDTNVDAILVDTDTTIPALIAALNDISVADVLTTQMTESYAANGVEPTLAQALFAIHQMLMDFDITSTNLTVRKLNSTTPAFIVTLSDATSPIGAERT